MAEHLLDDWRIGQNTRHTMVSLFRQSIFSRLAGYEDTNDAERLRVDPSIRYVVGGGARIKEATSTSRMGRFETEVLTQARYLDALKRPAVPRDHPAHGQLRQRAVRRAGSNGLQGIRYFGCTCHHSLFCFNQFADLERCLLRKKAT